MGQLFHNYRNFTIIQIPWLRANSSAKYWIKSLALILLSCHTILSYWILKIKVKYYIERYWRVEATLEQDIEGNFELLLNLLVGAENSWRLKRKMWILVFCIECKKCKYFFVKKNQYNLFWLNKRIFKEQCAIFQEEIQFVLVEQICAVSSVVGWRTTIPSYFPRSENRKLFSKI